MTDEDQLAHPLGGHLAFLLSRLRRFCFEAGRGTRETMSQTILITGGVRSGKSAIAEGRTLGFGTPAVYIATAQAFDGEMETRIATHQARRGAEWRTVQEPLDLVGALTATDGVPRLVDCLTLWLTNQMLGGHDWQAAGRDLCAALARQSAPVVLVTNEVGLGIVPENRLAREFRDAAGLLNQWVAAVADEVIFAVAGLPMKVK
jgi:adenosylcobinamide kinase/adenosylcobinamide-phosphate guanylyltransferase